MRPQQKALLDSFTRSLSSFQSSQDAFRILSTIQQASAAGGRSASRPTRLVILDSSFNPPTKAHAQMAKTALQASPSSKLLLLLAVQNADKAPKPASFPARLCMMDGFAKDLLRSVPGEIDLAVTTMPYFHGKANAIAELYPEVEQVFLTGYDTIIRIFDPKYYGEGEMDKVMSRFFTTSRVEVTLRPDDSWGTADEQREQVKKLVEQWESKVDVVEASDGVGVSSSKVRELIKDGKETGDMVCSEVKEWAEQGIYDET